MYTYNSFLNTKKYDLNENLLKTDQEEAVSRAIAEKKIILTDVPFYNSWKLNNDSNDIDFAYNVTINNDIEIKSIKDLGFTFGKVGGNFDCSGSEILNLLGAPKSCKSFDASSTNLKSLKGSPYMVENFDVSNSLIGSLKGAPRFVFGDFNLKNNMITDISDGPFLISGSIDLSGNNYGKPNKPDYKLFRNMHKFIMGEYMTVTPKYAVEAVEEAIQSKEYFINILSEDINYAQFFKGMISDTDLADAIVKLNPSPGVLNSIRNNLPLVWEEITKIHGEDSGYKTSADLGELGF
jgi:hypothetical protein